MPDWRRYRLDRAGVSHRTAVVVVGLFLSALIVAGGVLIGFRIAPRSSPPSAAPIPTSAVSPTQSPVTPPSSPQPNALAPLDADWAQLASQLHAQIGLAVSAVGAGQPLSSLGEWQTGPAWSTIKVPLAIAGLRAQDPPHVTEQMNAAITESDNAAAESIWQGLGDPVTAAHRVEDVLRETGDLTTVQSQKIRPEYTAFGQTIWPLTEQARFLAAAACDSRNDPIFSLMTQVEPDQRWGLGTIPDTQFKGGWGPSLSNRYLVRQMGILSTPNGKSAVAIAAEPASGSFADGTQDLTLIANWLSAHLAALPAGHC